jgi:GT2 family glycosyltransferase
MANAALSSEHDVGMWAPKILSMEPPHLIDSAGGLLIYGNGLAKGRGRLEEDRGQYDKVKEVFIPSACAALYRKTLLDETGGFDEDFFAYCEDTDLGLRARLSGWRTEYVAEAVVFHHYSGTSGRYTPFKAFLAERNHLWVAIKNFPLPLLALAPLYEVWRYVVEVYGLLAGRGAGARFSDDFSSFKLITILARAYIDAARELPRMLSKRREVQGKTRVSKAEIREWFRKYGLRASTLVLRG